MKKTLFRLFVFITTVAFFCLPAEGQNKYQKESQKRLEEIRRQREADMRKKRIQEIVKTILTPIAGTLKAPTDNSIYQDSSAKISNEKIKNYVMHSADERAKKIDNLKMDLVRFARGGASAIVAPVAPASPTWSSSEDISYTSQERKDKAVAANKERFEETLKKLHELQKNDPPFFAGMPYQTPAVGMIGSLVRFKIIQIISTSEAIVKPTYLPTANNFYVKGVDLTSHVDNTVVSSDLVFTIVGTKTYTTVIGGSNTIFVIEPVDMSKYMVSK